MALLLMWLELWLIDRLFPYREPSMNPLEVPHKSPASASPNGAADSMPLQRAVELIRAGLAVPAPAGGFALASPERSGAGKTLSLTALAQALAPHRWPWAVGLGFTGRGCHGVAGVPGDARALYGPWRRAHQFQPAGPWICHDLGRRQGGRLRHLQGEPGALIEEPEDLSNAA